MTYEALHNWLHGYNGWDNWEYRAGVMSEDDVMVEYDPCYKSNRIYSRTSIYHGFKGNFTSAQARRSDRNAYKDNRL